MARSSHGRGSLTRLEDRESILLLVSEAVTTGCSQYRACEAFNLEERTLQRWQKNTSDARRGPLTVPANKLTNVERDLVIKTSVKPEFVNLSPCLCEAILSRLDC